MDFLINPSRHACSSSSFAGRRVGDLLLWDNRCTLHARGDFDPSRRRWLRRVTLKGDTPRGVGDVDARPEDAGTFIS